MKQTLVYRIIFVVLVLFLFTVSCLNVFQYSKTITLLLFLCTLAGILNASNIIRKIRISSIFVMFCLILILSTNIWALLMNTKTTSNFILNNHPPTILNLMIYDKIIEKTLNDSLIFRFTLYDRSNINITTTQLMLNSNNSNNLLTYGGDILDLETADFSHFYVTNLNSHSTHQEFYIYFLWQKNGMPSSQILMTLQTSKVNITDVILFEYNSIMNSYEVR